MADRCKILSILKPALQGVDQGWEKSKPRSVDVRRFVASDSIAFAWQRATPTKYAWLNLRSTHFFAMNRQCCSKSGIHDLKTSAHSIQPTRTASVRPLMTQRLNQHVKPMLIHIIFRYNSTPQRDAIAHLRKLTHVTCRAVATPCMRLSAWYFHVRLLYLFTSHTRSFASRNTATAQNVETRNSCTQGAAIHLLFRPSFQFFIFIS